MFSDMGNEIRGSVCGESRWNIPATTPFGSFSPCFTTAFTTDLEAFESWDMKGGLWQCAAADDSDSQQDVPDSGCNVDGGYFMDANLPMNAAAEDWTQTINLINSGGGGGGERNYPSSQILLQEQEQMNSRLTHHFHGGDSQDPFFLDQTITTGFSQQQQLSVYENQQLAMAYHPASTISTPNFSTTSSCLSTHDHHHHHHHQVVSPDPNSFHPDDHDQLSIFSDQAAPPMWNTSSTNFFPSSTPSSLMTNSPESDYLEASTSTTKSKKKKSNHNAEQTSSLLCKRPRIETPSPLPTFKVRKEKMGDRITALQQLVSPFGKTDTASVLHEAIDYIKFLHGQVNALCNPYLKNGNLIQHQQINEKMMKKIAAKKLDLKSRGLCVVPISSTFPVASETTADFWTPTTFGGAFTGRI